MAEAIVAAAVPIDFDEQILDALLPPAADAHALVDELATLPFITRTNGDCTYYASARRSILKLARDENIGHVRELNAAAARYCESQLEVLAEGPDRERAKRSQMYHLLGAGGEDEDLGFALLVRLLTEAEAEYRPGVVFLLLQMAGEQEPILNDQHRLGLLWLNARLLIMQNQAQAAVKQLADLLGLPLSSALRPHVELTLANALCRTGQWADAAIHATNAHRGFDPGQPFDDAGPRGSRSLRPMRGLPSTSTARVQSGRHSPTACWIS